MAPYFQDGGHDVISRRKVLPCGECTLSVCQAHMFILMWRRSSKCYRSPSFQIGLIWNLAELLFK